MLLLVGVPGLAKNVVGGLHFSNFGYVKRIQFTQIMPSDILE
jgi:hypothetical protein